MQLSILLVILSVAALTLTKPIEPEAPILLSVGEPIKPSFTLLWAGVFESTANVSRWMIHLDPRFRVEAIVVDDLQGCRITSIQSGIGTFALVLGLEKTPIDGPRMFFQYTFYGTVMDEDAKDLKYEPKVEIVTV